jgi:hypothetical protein
MALKRMDNVGIVVEDLGGTIDFFRELGLELEGRATIEGEWAGLRVTPSSPASAKCGAIGCPVCLPLGKLRETWKQRCAPYG